jgi:hypothetical protein
MMTALNRRHDANPLLADDKAASPAQPSLYQRHLGENFAKLAPVLQRLHHGGNTVVTGELRVRWAARGWLRILQNLAPMNRPRPAHAAPCRVTMTASANGEQWHRAIGGRVLQSRFNNLASGLLVERAGPATLQLHSSVDAQGNLRQISRRISLFGIPAPSLHVTAIERAIDAQRYYCDVQLWSARWRRLLRYDGILTVQIPTDT